ncbi:MAG: peroxide stress protein YaaA [Rhodospirillaceae bacterium]|nr:MAG: peroxide stress protein YaaA [Rhodospirillaceae bacterium]
MLYALLSPAKKLDFKPIPDLIDQLGIKPTQPALLKDATIIVDRAKELSREQIKRLMDISPKLAELNYARFQSFDPTNRSDTKPAFFAFAGDVYVGLNAHTLEKADVAFAQRHIGIISGLYGLLRPLDAIQPYRLEMGSRLETSGGADLYAFWRDRLTTHVNAVGAKLKSATVVNLASNEYWSAIDERRLKFPVIQPVFKELRAGKAQVISFLAKKARGTMARAIIENRWENPEAMKDFDTDGYRYDPRASDETTWVFCRKAK